MRIRKVFFYGDFISEPEHFSEAGKGGGGFDTELTSGKLFSSGSYFCCTCVHSVSEWKKLEELKTGSAVVKKAFGFHPQKPDFEEEDALSFLENLLETGKIDAIGEAGFDAFTPEYKENLSKQEKAFQIELELAEKYGKPLVIHERKALDLIYRYAKPLSRLPSVLFHSFFYGHNEAESLLKKGINGYFSFGKQILNGNKKALDCAVNLPLERLLLETDAPYQTLKGENFTPIEDILKVYEKALELWNPSDKNEFFLQLKKNFSAVFG